MHRNVKKSLCFAPVTFAWACLFATMLFTSCLGENTEVEDPKEYVSIGDQLPSFSVRLSDGNTVKSSDLLGQCSYIVLFTTQCGDCRALLPTVEAFYREHSKKHAVNVLCIAREETSERAGAFWTEHKLTMPFAPQEDRKVYNLFANWGVPRVYISNEKGMVEAIFKSEDAPTVEQLERCCPECRGK